jgi:FG-GAP-like repeat
MQLSYGHIDNMLGASFAPRYVIPVQFVSGTSQTAEYYVGPVFATVTVSVVNDPILENATGNLVVNNVGDNVGPGFFFVDTHLADIGSDPYQFDAPQAAFGGAGGQSGAEYFILGFNSLGILVSADGDLDNPVSPTYSPYFVISSTNLGAKPGAQLTFYRHGEFDGTFGSGGVGSGGGPPNPAGQAAIWGMNGNTITGGGAVNPNPGPSWRAIGAGSFFGSDPSDILWQNATTGQVAVWEIASFSEQPVGGGAVTQNPGPSWKAIGTADFNDDGHPDIRWQNASTGQASIWEMNGNTLTGGGAVTQNPGPSWRAVGAGDFNDDGHSDILFQNTGG